MATATQAQVRRAIEQSGATGAAAEVLTTITDESIEKTNPELQTSRGLAIALGLQDAATAIGGLKAASAENPLLDSMYVALSSTGLDFSHSMVRDMIDQLTGVVFTSELAGKLKSLGVWHVSPLEVAAGARGATTDEQTVQSVLDEVASEQSQLSLRRKIADGYNAVVAKVDIAEITTVEDALAMFTQLINAE